MELVVGSKVKITVNPLISEKEIEGTVKHVNQYTILVTTWNQETFFFYRYPLPDESYQMQEGRGFFRIVKT